MRLLPWTTISANYRDCALIGNGASIAVARTLSYNSLYDAAVDRGHVDGGPQAIFDFFDTRDFEFVLRALSHANAINRHLGLVETATRDCYESVRNTLIKTVKAVHPEHRDLSHHFNAISGFLAQFPTVFSLNYDLIIYWAMMEANASAGGNLFKDCFLEARHFEGDYDYLRRPHANLASSTLVFYPHGNLALATDMWGTETKISQNVGTLIDAITANWTLGGNTPLFVSEGDTERKLRSIRRNGYLNAVYAELGKRRDSVLVYGWAFGGQDQHILDALSRADVSRFAISVYTGLADPEHFCYEATRAVHQTRGLESAHIDLFDSADSGTWITP